MEYALATTLKKLSINEKPKIALIQGHGEPSKAALTQAIQNLGRFYSFTFRMAFNFHYLDKNNKDCLKKI